MVELTILTTCAPFEGHLATIQHNALRAWLSAFPGLEVIVLGDEPGVKDACADYGLRQIAKIPRGRRGRPRIRGMMLLGELHAETKYLMYCNADVILLGDLVEMARACHKALGRFLLVGPRYNVKIDEPIICVEGWQDRLRGLERDLRPRKGCDYFLWIRGSGVDVADMPRAFVAGQPAWDHWYTGEALRQDIPVVNAADALLALHQDHAWRVTETDYRVQGAIAPFNRYKTYTDATHRLLADLSVVEA